jgi:hypothetical protein
MDEKAPDMFLMPQRSSNPKAELSGVRVVVDVLRIVLPTVRSLFLRGSFFFLCMVLLGGRLFYGCAGQVAPSGGPPDTSPPHVISTYPLPNATNVTDARIALEFDEYVDKRSVEESIFISPYLGDLDFEWSGREVEIRFTGRLRENTTYVVTVGTDVVDFRARNRMAETFTLAFSTGAHLDRGALGGKVFPVSDAEKPEGVMVFAYRLDNLNPDTLNPRSSNPDYITQTGKGGNFRLSHLRFGRYRLVAVRDELRNLLYDPETDQYGLLPFDVLLNENDSVRFGLAIRLAKEDTTSPRLIKAAPVDRHHLLLEFSDRVGGGYYNSRYPYQ